MNSTAAQFPQMPSGPITSNQPSDIDYSNIRNDFKDRIIQDIPRIYSVPRVYGNSACKYIEKIIEEKGDDIKNYFSDFLGGIIDAIFEKGLKKKDSDLYFIVGEFGHATYYEMNLKEGDAKKSHDLSKMRPESYLNTIFKGIKYKPHIIKEFTSAIIETLLSDYESPYEKETSLNMNEQFKEKYEEIFHEIDAIYRGIAGGSLKDQMKVCSIDATKAIEKHALLVLQSGTDIRAKIEILAYLYKDALNPVKPIESETLDGLFRPLKMKILLKRTEPVEAEIQNLTEGILENFLAAGDQGPPSTIKETYEKIVTEMMKSQISLHPKGATKAIEISALKYVYEPGPDADEKLKRIAYFYNNALYSRVHSTPAESEILKILFQQFKMDVEV